MRTSLVGIGLGAFGLALAAASIGLGPGGGWVRPVAFLGAAVALVVAAWLVYRRSSDRRNPIPAVETAVASDPPGARLDDALGSLVGRELVELTPRGIRDALRHAATGVIVSRDGVSEREAVAMVDDGSWTDDGVAAQFLQTSWVLPTESVRDRVRRAFGRGPERPLVRAARRGADAITARAGIDGPADAVAGSWFPPGAAQGSVPTTVTGHEFDDAASADEAADGPVDASGAMGVKRRADGMVDESGDRTVCRSRVVTRRFRGVAAFALLALGVGTFTGAPGVVFAAVPAVAFLAWARTVTVPAISLRVDREIDGESPEAGDLVHVRTTIENAGSASIVDCRLVDGVPAALAVVDGSARTHCRLRPGESVTMAYDVRARRGVHEFDATLAIVRDPAGTVEEHHVVRAPDEIACVPPLASLDPTVPLRQQATAYAGSVDVDEGGAGLEFFQTREYRHGDPLSRIDWHRLARTGELATTEFRQERAATVVLVVDARAAGYVAPDPNGQHALDRAVDAVGMLTSALLADGNRVGVGAVSTEDCWLVPGAGDGHRERVRRLLGTHPALSPVPADRNLRVKRTVERLRRRIPDGAQVLFLTALCDDRAARIARRFEAGGRAVTVISPDSTLARTPSLRLARVGRRLRVTGLRQRGVRVVDWGWNEPLAVALSRSRARGDVR